MLRSLDWWTIAIYVALLVFGWMSVCGASYSFNDPDILSLSTRSGMQIVWIGTSICLGFVLLMLDDRYYDTFAYVLYAALLLLLFVTIFNPHEIKGSRSWLVMGPLRIQPAEFAKFATALAISKFMSTYGFNIHRMGDFALSCAIVLLPMGLIIMQKETGSALVYLSFFLMFYREGMPGSILFTGVAMVVYFVVGIRYEQEMLWDTPTSEGKFVVLLLIQLFSAALVRIYCADKAKALGTVLLTLRGTPFVMQGEELGYANRVWKSIDEFDDLQTRSQYEFALEEGFTADEALAACNRFSRDNARTPMQWNAGKNAGFSEADATWLPVHDDFANVNVEAESADSASVLSWYRKLAALRGGHEELITGSYEELLAESEQVYAFRRKGEDATALVLANLSDEKASYDASLLDGMKLLAGTHGETAEGALRPFEAVVFES